MYYLETGFDKHAQFRNAVLLALVVHAALILTISFKAGTPTSHSAPQIEVIFASLPSTVPPKDARQIAQANQGGSSDESATDQISSINNLPPVKYLEPRALTPKAQIKQHRDLLTTVTTTSLQTPVTPVTPKTYAAQEINLQGISPEVDHLNEQLVGLQETLQRQTETYSSYPRVERLNTASTKRSADAAYLLEWQRHLEAVGNYYYPQASVRYGIYGDLRMLVVIRQDGSLEDIQILSSSGHAVLDEAAIRIVRRAAPYSPFPPELQASTDTLEIVRTWHFRENPLSSR